MMKLPENYHHPQTYWAHMLTLRCNAKCPFCILNGRGKCSITGELPGGEILEFWNGLEHNPGQRLSLIGGETTLHADIVEIVQGLENYSLTLTTNCFSPFYRNEKFWELLKPHPTSTLRINTTFHPGQIKPEQYIEVIRKFRESDYFVDQTSYVYRPDIKKYADEIAIVEKEIKLTSPPFLGFWDEECGFDASFDPANIEPNESYHSQEEAARICGLHDIDAYRDMCGQHTKREVICDHPMRSLIVGPDGFVYHCHYKMYYGIDPHAHISGFKPVRESDRKCRHYGFCNWCDVPRVGCVKNETAKPLVLNKLFDGEDGKSREVNTLFLRMQKFAQENALEFNSLKWFEHAYAFLYSGHRHAGKTLDVGSARSVWPYWLAANRYDVTIVEPGDNSWRASSCDRMKMKIAQDDITDFKPEFEGQFDFITALSVVEHISDDTLAVLNMAKYLKRGGVLFLSTDFYDRYIEYPDANRTIVRDKETHTDSRIYDKENLFGRIIEPLIERGDVEVMGETDYDSNMDRNVWPVRKLYTFAIACLRKK